MKSARNNKISQSPRLAHPSSEIAHLIAPILRAKCISVRQFDKAMRYAAVQLERSRFGVRKPNKAQIAFSTGLSRNEVSLLLRLPLPEKQNYIEGLIRAWKSDSRFRNDKNPGELAIFGKVRSFEQLVKLHGKGLPVRAILDELSERGIVLLSQDQRVQLQFDSPQLSGAAWSKLMTRIESAVGDALELGATSALSDKSAKGARRKHLKRSEGGARLPQR